MNYELLTNKKLWLAPLAGFTDAPFRYIAKKCGADVLVSEMVSADGVKKNFDKMAHYTKFTESERPFGIQLFGDNPAVMARAAQILARLRPDFFDINMGCPVKKVVKRYAGSALMLKPDLAEQIIREVSGVLKGEGIALTVKIRAGWDLDNINAVPFAQMVESAGADAIIVHPRTRSQLFTGHSNWDIIRQVKEAVNIPVVGNGDIQDYEDVKNMYAQTNCDSVMIGRGALGRPWVFWEIRNAECGMRNEGFLPLNADGEIDKLAIIFEHIDRVLEHTHRYSVFGVRCSVFGVPCSVDKVDTPTTEHRTPKTDFVPPAMRAHFAFYTKGWLHGALARKLIFATTDANEIKETLRKCYYGEL